MPQNPQQFITRQHMLASNYEIFLYRDSYLHDVALHHHDFYEIYLFLAGNVNYSIESKNYTLLPGDILLISPLELHQPRISEDTNVYERMVLWVSKSFLESCCSAQTNLTRCFDITQTGHTNLLRLPINQRQFVTGLMEKLLAERQEKGYGGDLAAMGCLLQLMVEINRLQAVAAQHFETKDKSSTVVSGVLAYINEHYQEELSLDMLATKFFISKYHLSHEFLRLVGTSVYRYIIQKRLIIAKQMLNDRMQPTEVYQNCGFGDYANFYRAFKSAYDISPKEYMNNVRNGNI